MKTLPLTEVKKNLGQLIDEIRATEEEIMITKQGYPVAVLISPDELERWKETIAIRLDPAFMEEIQQGLQSLQAETKLYTLEELLLD
jgi:antitoxin YefM